ncbi:MAG TPA: YkgJ family cysteine cluster protein [Bryobacteraceae bacterium]|nr:YkgJ family cysteine cluster protein [Bryobacteraceae bacterium]
MEIVKDRLFSIQNAIADRVSAIVAGRGAWPCHAGCDHCCRHLAAVPVMSGAEWELLTVGLDALPEARRRHIEARIRRMEAAARPYTCPMLDTHTGQCMVYAQRPLACRTYGFYVEREAGLYCREIDALADAGEMKGVVWGSQASIEDKSAVLGPKRSLLDWFRNSPAKYVSQSDEGSAGSAGALR